MSSDIDFDQIGFGNGNLVPLDQVPDEFMGTILRYAIERDADGNINKIKLVVQWGDKVVVISYPKIYHTAFAESMKKLGFSSMSQIVGKTFKWKRMPVPYQLRRKVNYNKRHLPITLTAEKQEEEEPEVEEEQEAEEEQDNVAKIKSKFKNVR